MEAPVQVRRGASGIAATGVLALCAAWTVFRWLQLCATKAFAIDEFVYAHRAWAAHELGGAAKVFGGVHGMLTPLLYGPFVALAGDDPSKLVLLRGGSALFGLLTMVCLAICVARGLDRHRLAAALTIPMVAMLSKPLAWHMAEIRPDGPAFAFVAMSVALLGCRRLNDRTAAAAAGVCLLLGCLSSIKVVMYGAVFAPVFLVDVALRRDGPRILRRPWLFAATFLTGLASVALVIWGTGHGDPFIDGIGRLRAHQAHYPEVDTAKHFMPWFRAAVVVFALASAGVVSSAADVVRDLRAGRRPGPALLEILLLVSTLASFAVQKAPYPYSLIPGAAMVTLFAVRAIFRWLPATTLTQARSWGLGASAAAASVAIVLAIGADIRLKPKRNNRRQTEILADLHGLVPPGDTVYDMAASYVFRPPAYRMEIVDRYREKKYRKQILAEVPRALRAKKTMVVIEDFRLHKRWKNTSLGRHLKKEYQRFNDDIRVRGRKWTRRQHSKPQKFLALRSGEYFFWPKNAHKTGALTVDGVAVTDSIVTLTEGSHTVLWKTRSKSSGDLYLIWRPPTGETWNPKRKGKGRVLARYILP